MADEPSPEQILQVGLGFWASKTLLSAVELEVFTALGSSSMMAPELGDRIGLHARSRVDFLDALVSLGFLTRDGDGSAAAYSNTTDTAVFLDKGSAGLHRWPARDGQLAPLRLLGQPDRGHCGRASRRTRSRAGADDPFAVLYADEQRLEVFLARDAGHPDGQLHGSAREGRPVVGHDTVRRRRRERHPVRTVPRNATRNCGPSSFDLPAVEPVAKRTISRDGCRGPGQRGRRRLLRGRAPPSRRHRDGQRPARLGRGTRSRS